MKKYLLSFALLLLMTVDARADVTIGFAAPLTGQYAVFGEQLRHGAEQAVTDLNAQGGINGQKIIMASFDDACDPRQAVTVANEIASKGIKFMVGHFCSGAAIPASKVYNEENVLMISPAATSPVLTEQGFGNVFRVSGRGDQLGPTIAQYIATHFKEKNVALIQDQSAYGRAIADETKKSLNEQGVKEVLYESYTPGERDYSSLITKLKQAGVQILFIGGYHTEAGLITRQLREQKSDIQVVGGNALMTSEFWSITGPAGEGVLIVFGPDPRNTPAAKQAVDALRKNHYEPEGYTLYTYAAFQAIAEGAKRAKSLDPTKVEEALKQNSLPTVLGPVSFDAKGDVKDFKFRMYQCHNGTYQEAVK